MYILAINPGAVTTKYAVYHNKELEFEKKFEHTTSELKAFEKISDQYAWRMNFILEDLKLKNFELSNLSGVVGRGGLLKPVAGGTYAINDDMLYDLKLEKRGAHASNLGALISYELGKSLGIPSFIVDPVSVDELEDVARITGMPEIERVSLIHALNHKAVARKVAEDMGKKYEEVNFIVAHLGTGISIVAHKKGKAIDVCDPRGEGPFSCERCGMINGYLLLDLAFSGQYTKDALKKYMSSQSGLFAHLGTKDFREVENMVKNGDKKASLIFETMVYQICKEIGAQSAVLCGEVDRIIVTGGMAYSSLLIEKISKRTSYIAPVVAVPGEKELESLALGAYRVLSGKEELKTY